MGKLFAPRIAAASNFECHGPGKFSSKVMVFMVDFINKTRSSRGLVVEYYLDYECRGDYTNR
jgi:hypothetical protein